MICLKDKVIVKNEYALIYAIFCEFIHQKGDVIFLHFGANEIILVTTKSPNKKKSLFYSYCFC